MKFWTQKISRRIFAWLGLTILVTILLMAGLTYIMVTATGDVWANRLHFANSLMAQHFVKAWHDPEVRDERARRISQGIKLHITLEEPDGTHISSWGPPPSHMISRAPIVNDGKVVGVLVLSKPHEPKFLLIPFSLVIFLGCGLWIGSLAVARQIALPLQDLESVAKTFGEGELSARSLQVARRPDEIGTLATTLHEMAERVDGQIRDQRTLLAAVSHELRTPLGHLKLLVELARHEQFSPQRLDELLREVNEMDELVDQLMATSRLNFELAQARMLDPVELALSALDRAGLPPEILEVEESAPFQGDPTLVQRALANLLRNAERHGKGVTRLVICVRDEHLVFVIEDQGPGMPETERQRLFEPFVQGVTFTRSGSLGLGLYLVRRIAHAHNGSVIAENSPQGGARLLLQFLVL